MTTELVAWLRQRDLRIEEIAVLTELAR